MPSELPVSSSDSRVRPIRPSGTASSVVTAQWCARRGWPVHPLAPSRKTPTANCLECRTTPHQPGSCLCIQAGRWCHGFHAATLDETRIQKWWGHHPEFGVGVSCGPANLVVIDVDAHAVEVPARNRLLPGIPIGDQVDLTGLSTGFHTLAVLAALRGQRSPAEDSETLRVSTPSGGLHVWYQSRGAARWLSSVGSTPGRALAWQVDVRAHGSYIIAPGTTTGSGSYAPVGETREPAPLPLWLAQELTRTGHFPAPAIPAPRLVPPRAQQAVFAAGSRRHGEWTLAPILAPVEACGSVAEGAGFSDTLNRAAYTIGGLIAAGRLQREGAQHALRESARRARPGQERRIEQIIQSGLEAGLARPLEPKGRRA
ncbi:bifunctional DNA primase/polymerase [Streptomyces sp. NPDC094468]|uniref:bifunctional DNA primase/polymerase n=1 Tax=Streptomyces sp. NPDC094468 TaxID=3366066 RepID=UPI0038057348